MCFSRNYGCEFYEGDANIIGATVSASDWDALRNGIAAHSFVGFPRFIWGGYFDLLSAAVSSVVQQREVPIHALRTVAGEEGNWGADVLPADWVAAVASVPAKSIWLLSQRWREAYLREYEEHEAWPDDELLDPLYRLTVLCREALSRHTDVVLLTI